MIPQKILKNYIFKPCCIEFNNSETIHTNFESVYQKTNLLLNISSEHEKKRQVSIHEKSFCAINSKNMADN